MKMSLHSHMLVCTLAITSGLGFSYWWFAARQFPEAIVGFALAANSAMALLANFCLLGLGTLLITELPRRKGQEGSLVSMALIVVGVAGGCAGVLFAILSPFLAQDLKPLQTNILNIFLFAAGISLTSMVLILDQVFIAMLQGGLQLWRNAIFSVGKLLALFAVSKWVSQELGIAIYAAWAVGNLLSFLVLVGLVLWKGRKSQRNYWPNWGLLRRLGPAALLHHVLNLILQAPTLVLPLVVTALLPISANAWFGTALMIVTFLFAISTALTVVLHATNPTELVVLREKTRMTVSVATVTALGAGTVLLIGAEPILSLFGPGYIQNSSWILRILAFGAFPLIVKDHYIAISRIKDTVAKAIIPIAVGALLELSIASLGANFGNLLGFDGLLGLSLGWVIALYIESLFMFPVLYKVMTHTTLITEEQIREVAQKRTNMPVLSNVAVILLPVAAITLWCFSLQNIHLEHMTSLGLISVFPPSLLFALLLLAISFCVALQRPRLGVMLLHIGLLIFMLYGITALVEEMPRFDIVYRHAGYTEYIMRNHTVDPNLDAYFSWPGFFSLSAFVTLIAGFHDVLAYAAWVPVLYNVLYFGPLYMIFSSFTSHKQLIWLSLFFFYVTNWIGQDYISPQGFNFFLYLVIIAILLKWFTPSPTERPHILERLFSRISPLARFFRWLTTSDIRSDPSQPAQRIALMLCIIAVFAFSVFSHQLSPFFILASVAALVLCRHSTLWWLPLVMVLMVGAWIFFMTQSFLAGHIGDVIGDAGNINASVGQNVTSRVVGDPGHTFIVEFRLVMTILIWGLALLGGILRARKGYHDSPLVLLALAPFPVFVVQSYGGEVLLRIYLFTLPIAVFLAASSFYLTPRIRTPNWAIVARIALTLALLGAFLFTRYGNESMDYKTKNEVTGVQQLYKVAPLGSCFFQTWGGTPWQFEQYEHYQLTSFGQDQSDPLIMKAIITQDIPGIEQYITKTMTQNNPQCSLGYLIFTHSQNVAFDLTSGFQPGILDQLAKKISTSQDFKLMYSNPDVQIFLFVGTTKGGQ
ncbi:MAG: hypothetical protein E6J34_08075 [Chloroflexi bacterium]|nr:MAG: hypothetical protein E6J34_08075 [Chloroflexota bacterium]